jgi:hypothetical protein
MSTTLLTTALLDEAGYAFAARVTGVRDVMSASVKASGAALAFWLLRRVRPGFVFSLGAAALFLFSALLGVWMASDAHLCHRETKNPAA